MRVVSWWCIAYFEGYFWSFWVSFLEDTYISISVSVSLSVYLFVSLSLSLYGCKLAELGRGRQEESLYNSYYSEVLGKT